MRILEHNCLKFFQPLSCLRQALQTRTTFSIAYPNRQIFFLSKKLSDISLSAGWFCIFSLALFFSFCFVLFFLLIDVKMHTKTLRRTYSGVFLNLPLLPLHRCLSEKKKTSVSCSKKCPNIIVTAPRQLWKIKTLLCSKCQLPLGNLRPSSLGIKSTYPYFLRHSLLQVISGMRYIRDLHFTVNDVKKMWVELHYLRLHMFKCSLMELTKSQNWPDGQVVLN